MKRYSKEILCTKQAAAAILPKLITEDMTNYAIQISPQPQQQVKILFHPKNEQAWSAAMRYLDEEGFAHYAMRESEA